MVKKLHKILQKLISSKGLFAFVLASLAIATIFVSFQIAFEPGHKGDYLLLLVQCILGILLLFVPSLAAHSLKVTLSSWMMVAYVLFIYCALYLGEVHMFYYRVPHWDTILHFSSGALLGILAYTLVSFLNNSDTVPVALSPLFVAVFTFSFAISLGVLWEVYEFTFDSLLGMNMQKFATEDGTLLVGRTALQDTMKDLIAACIGALIFSIIGFFAVKKKSAWLQKLSLKRLK
ncbi:MAG: hypothetical protein LBM12_00400 [Candidatus Nomurabacteria bacterium]|jgi:hypothetical protein|nr:hypothetical protein [Candidatus Nomurabacteria bacterium]